MNSNTITCMVPLNLKIDELTQKIPPTFSYKRDGFIYLVDLWFQQYEWSKNDSNYIKDDYLPFHSQSLKFVLYDYQKYLEYLIQNEVFEVNSSYQTNVKSKSYKLNSIYYTDLVEDEILDRRIVEKILQSRNISQTEVNEKYRYITKWFDKLTVDEAEAYKYIEQYIQSKSKAKSHSLTRKRLQLKKISYILSVKRISNKNYRFSIDQKSGRLYTPLTNLKKELRQFLKYDGKKIVAIDLSNSQPYLSTILLDKDFYKQTNNIKVNRQDLTEWVKNKTNQLLEEVYWYIRIGKENEGVNKKNKNTNTNGERSLPMCGKVGKIHTADEEWNKFRSLVSRGEFYEYIGKYISSRPKSNLVQNPKKLVITVLFSSPTDDREYFKINAKLFEELFPSLYRVYKIIKSNDHSSLAVLLQNIEAEVFLNRICSEIESQNLEIPIFTIHDSICTTEEHLNKVRYIMNHNLKRAVGLAPKLKIEYW